MNIFITGGTSFIGAWVVEALLAKGHACTVLTRDPDRIAGFRERPGLSLVKGTLVDPAAVESGLARADAVIHLAHVPADGGAARLLADAVPTVHLLESAAAAGVRRFIYTSSTSALGELSRLMPEDRATLPNAWWCANKAAVENFVFAASYETQMRCVVIRPGLTFGKPAAEGGASEAFPVFRDIVNKALNGERIDLRPGDGTQMTFAGDVAKVYVAVLESDVNRKTYHALTPERTLWFNYARKVQELTASFSSINEDHSLEPAFECRYSADAIREDFGLVFRPWPTLEDYVKYLIVRAREEKGR